MKRTYSSTFKFKCQGLVSIEDLYSNFYEGWPHFLQGYLMGIVMGSQRPWTASISVVKVRSVDYHGIEERGEVKSQVQTTLHIDGREKKFNQSDDDGEIREAKEEIQNLMKLAAEFYQKSYLDSLPNIDDDEEDESEED